MSSYEFKTRNGVYDIPWHCYYLFIGMLEKEGIEYIEHVDEDISTFSKIDPKANIDVI